MAQSVPIVGTASSMSVSGTTWNGGYSWTYRESQEVKEATNYSTASGEQYFLAGLPVTREFTVVGEITADDSTILGLFNAGQALTTIVLAIDGTKSITCASATIISVDGPNTSRRGSEAVGITINCRMNGVVTKDYTV